jgi:ribonuclease G
MSELGLIEMTRKRTRENLSRLMSEPCTYCEGRGTLKSKKTICYEIFRDIEREAASSINGGNVYVRVNPEIDRVLKEEEQESIMDMERRIDRPIIIISKEDFHLEQYAISTDGI